MENNTSIKIIAKIHTDFKDKFGIPRQSGLVKSLQAVIVFEPEYRNPDAFRGIEQFSHLWLIWQFSESLQKEWSPTVRPPRLGGNKKIGIFATRSPFRPNPLGLSSVKLQKVEQNDKLGTLLYVSGADLMDGTPIYDIKPYLPYTDCHESAKSGYSAEHLYDRLEVETKEELQQTIPPEILQQLAEILSLDPRPSYQNDPERLYGLDFAGYNIKFRVNNGILTVENIIKTSYKDLSTEN